MTRTTEVMITEPAFEHQQRLQALQGLLAAADKMLFISPIGMKGTVQNAGWTQLRAAIDQAKPFTTEGL